MRAWVREGWALLKEAISGFINDNALSHGAAMAFCATTSLAPILLIVVAIAGLVFGNDAARLALSAQVSGVIGAQSADLLQATIETASRGSSGTLATLLGLVTLLVTASGVFGEMQLSLDEDLEGEARWHLAVAIGAGARREPWACRRPRLHASGIAGGEHGDLRPRRADQCTSSVRRVDRQRHQQVFSFVPIAFLFAAIYKVLPDHTLQWRDVAVGSLVTTLLFTIGKALLAGTSGRAP